MIPYYPFDLSFHIAYAMRHMKYGAWHMQYGMWLVIDIFRVNLELSDDPPAAATVGIRRDLDNQEIPPRAQFHNTE